MKRRIAVVCIGVMLASSVLAGNVDGKEPESKRRGAAYSDVNGDGICDNQICGYQMEFCKDEDQDGWCDEKKRCYVDADEDGVCDECKEFYVDADGVCNDLRKEEKKADKVMHKNGRYGKNEGIRHGRRNCR